MPDTDKMRCPECGAEMNHHADKLDYGAADDDEAASAAVIEAHTCPDCGRTETRPSRQGGAADE
jgi:predicted RNA-binding Zn-ribbon protein involved in translation (DUF1610 family)